MMNNSLDLRGLSCPIPLLRTKEALEKALVLSVVVDEPVARENIIKFAKAQNCQVELKTSGSDWCITIRK